MKRVLPPDEPGASPAYEFGSNLDAPSAFAIITTCRQEYQPYVPKTEAELRAIYSRWVQERTCLVGLGYQPAEPPSVETFLDEWDVGPWMPIDGVDTSTWTDAQYEAAKTQCTLEMFDRD